jgi:hypothetical protein
MNAHKTLGARLIRNSCWMLVAITANFTSAFGQRFELIPLVGARASGSVEIQQEGQTSRSRADLGNGVTLGLAAGFRFDGDDFAFDGDACRDCSLVGIRWTIQNTHLALKETTPFPSAPGSALGRTSVTLNHFLADFAHEWVIHEAESVRPFVSASLGAALLSTPLATRARFAFGIGTGVKIFPHPRWGFRFQVEYLPMVMHAEAQRIVCAGGCVVALSGGVLNQFEVSIGPAFRF